MALTISVEIKRSFKVDCPADDVFNVLSDVPYSASHFPKVDQLIDMGDNTFRWEMEKLGIDKYSIQTIYAARYSSNRDQGRVQWEPVKGIGNGSVAGEWNILPENGMTCCDFLTHGELSLPLPKLVKFIVSPFVIHEFEGMVDTYIKNLRQTLES